MEPPTKTFRELMKDILDVLCSDDGVNYTLSIGICESQATGIVHLESDLIRPIPNLEDRVLPREPMPAGESPTDHSLCHRIVNFEICSKHSPTSRAAEAALTMFFLFLIRTEKPCDRRFLGDKFRHFRTELEVLIGKLDD